MQPRGQPPGDAPAADAPNIDGDPLGGLDFSGWEPRLDACGRLGLEPGDGCPECGSLEWWSDLTGGRHGAECDRGKLEKALGLARPGGPCSLPCP